MEGAGEKREATRRREEGRPWRRFGGSYGSTSFEERRDARAGFVGAEGDERHRIGSRDENELGESESEEGM